MRARSQAKANFHIIIIFLIIALRLTFNLDPTLLELKYIYLACHYVLTYVDTCGTPGFPLLVAYKGQYTSPEVGLGATFVRSYDKTSEM